MYSYCSLLTTFTTQLLQNLIVKTGYIATTTSQWACTAYWYMQLTELSLILCQYFRTVTHSYIALMHLAIVLQAKFPRGNHYSNNGCSIQWQMKVLWQAGCTVIVSQCHPWQICSYQLNITVTLGWVAKPYAALSACKQHKNSAQV